ncbi:carboxymuconolactone decarboxylase family protein [Paracidovorax konjaci]|uniref:Uncharacterized protein n=1 Tax=Paracidovorax konjaci TaxID=32040 RepID=A0A1I1WLY2_9BURK|nr:hypothetical protein [Paracidovorax konjaci]SFD96177.1 hypothetical protein SAMN04489710_11071 [Paracidovorax konjaci]
MNTDFPDSSPAFPTGGDYGTAFDARECAALAWTEALTLVASSQVPDSAYAEVSEQFTEAEIVELSMDIVAINGWNRLMGAFHAPPGGHPVA